MHKIVIFIGEFYNSMKILSIMYGEVDLFEMEGHLYFFEDKPAKDKV